MNNVFNRVKMLKSSDDCNKFSKSVSYETLVGGTATTGREYKQTQRLSEGSADKPLIAIGTLTSLLCNSAKVVEKLLRHVITRRTLVRRGYLPEQGTHTNKESLFASVTCFMRLPRRIQRMLLVTTIPTHALIFTLITIGESWADDETPVCKNAHGGEVTCIEKLADKNGNNSCGDNCSYKVIVENGEQVLHIYKTDISKSASIRSGAFSPTFYAGNQVLDATRNALPLNNIVLDNDFENIGGYAFAESGAQISTASGKFIVNKTGNYAFFNGLKRTTMNADVIFNNKRDFVLEGADINGDVIISDGVTEMGVFTLGATRIDGNIIIPQSVEKIHLDSLLLYSLTGQIYCASGIENCYNMIIAGCSEKEGRSECFKGAKNLLDSNKFSVYPDGCLSMGVKARCTKCKSASFKLEDDGWCLRKIYTPAEAAEVLNDDNTNEITITFKK